MLILEFGVLFTLKSHDKSRKTILSGAKPKMVKIYVKPHLFKFFLRDFAVFHVLLSIFFFYTRVIQIKNQKITKAHIIVKSIPPLSIQKVPI